MVKEQKRSSWEAKKPKSDKPKGAGFCVQAVARQRRASNYSAG